MSATQPGQDAEVGVLARRVLAEVETAFAQLAADAADRLATAILDSRRIACFSVGREGLMVRAFAMRLMHLGLDAHVVGDMTTPPAGPGDLLIVSAGPGDFSTARALLGVARAAGARSLVVTAQPDGAAARMADIVITVPAQTMSDDLVAGGPGSVLPMGSIFEISELIFFDLVTLVLRDRLGQSAADMRERHTNLE